MMNVAGLRGEVRLELGLVTNVGLYAHGRRGIPHPDGHVGSPGFDPLRAEPSAARRHWSTATASPSHPENGRSGVCWARRTPRTPSGSRTSSTCAWTCSAADMRRYSCRNAPMASGAPPNPTPNFKGHSCAAGTARCLLKEMDSDPNLLERETELSALDR